MQKILRKRVLRDLKANAFRYAALGLLIILCMYLIVSMVGAAETIIAGVENKGNVSKVEDGEFTTFLPLTKQQFKDITDKGITLEEQFYLDYKLKDSSVLRIFKTRDQINKNVIDKGRIAQNANEVVLEKRYCEEHNYKVNDKIRLSSNMYKIVGICTVPDYDAMHKEFAETAVESKQFGLAFVKEQDYKKLLDAGGSEKSETYVYAYRLNGKKSNQKFKEDLKTMKVEPEKVKDKFFQEYWKQQTKDQDDYIKGMDQLNQGSTKLNDGLDKLSGKSKNLNEASDKIFTANLQQASQGLKEYGLKEDLTEENYIEQLTDLKQNCNQAVLRLTIQSTLEQLKVLEEYKDGVAQYTKGVDQASNGADSVASGANKLNDGTKELMEELGVDKIDNLTSFLIAKDNPRIKASANDQVIDKLAGLLAGIIVMVLVTYVISVFVIHGIEKETSVIGALYALGVQKKDLIFHYLCLPVVVAFVAGLIGTLIGFSSIGIDVQMKDCFDYFSVPQLDKCYPLYLIGYGVVMPPVVAAIVNYMGIQKHLSKPALTMLRGEAKQSKISNINLGNMGFVARFRIRQMLREIRTGFTVIFGMFISLLILMLGVDCYTMCSHVSEENKADTKYNYMYTYKYPEEKVPDGGSEAYAIDCKKEMYGYQLDVTILGIRKDNPYFNAKVKKNKNQVVISSAMAQKYKMKIGDKIILTDKENDLDYAFTVSDITQYSVGFYAFMDIDSMRERFDADEQYYNVVFSKEKLNIPAGKLYSISTKKDIKKASDIFITQMQSMIIMLLSVSIIVFCVVMYLMMKVMIDRSTFHISLIKIFGFRSNEIKKLYLNGNFYIVAVGAAICIPATKFLMDCIYPLLISNVGCGMNLSVDWKIYLMIYVGIILLYVGINKLLVHRLNQMVPAEVLKNRE